MNDVMICPAPVRDDRDGMEYSISGKLAPNELGYRATIGGIRYGTELDRRVGRIGGALATGRRRAHRPG